MEMKNDIVGLKNDNAIIKSDIVGLKNKLDSMDNKISKAYNSLDSLKKNIGMEFEKFNKRWIREFFSIPTEKIVTRHEFPDPKSTVHKGKKVVELDIFCENPLHVAEVKTIISKNMINRIKTFAKKVKR